MRSVKLHSTDTATYVFKGDVIARRDSFDDIMKVTPPGELKILALYFDWKKQNHKSSHKLG